MVLGKYYGGGRRKGTENKWGHHTEEAKLKISEANTRKVRTPEMIKRYSESHMGVAPGNKGMKMGPHSKDHNEKISVANKIKMQDVVHHRDGNHDNDVMENRQHMTQSEHVKLHIEQGDTAPWVNRWENNNELNGGEIRL